MSRPDYVHCVLLGTFVEGTDRPEYETWCGRRTGNVEFAFVNASHAVLSARSGSRLLACEKCSKSISETLAKGTWSDD